VESDDGMRLVQRTYWGDVFPEGQGVRFAPVLGEAEIARLASQQWDARVEETLAAEARQKAEAARETAWAAMSREERLGVWADTNRCPAHGSRVLCPGGQLWDDLTQSHYSPGLGTVPGWWRVERGA
jgi:hypothetical protein